MTDTMDPPIEAGEYPTGSFMLIPIDLLHPAADNVRSEIGDVTELAASIAAQTLLQPLRVKPDGDGYTIIAGHRRHAAIELLRKKDKTLYELVPSTVERADLSDGDRVAQMLVENLQREDLDPIEEGNAFARLTTEFKWKRPELAKRIGRSPSYIGSRLALVALPESAKALLSQRLMPIEVGVKLAALKDDETVEALCAKRPPSLQEIVNAQYKLDARRLLAEYERELTNRGIAFDHKRRDYNTERVAVTFETPASVNEITKQVAKGLTVHLIINDYNGTVSAEGCVTETEEERKARIDKALQERTAQMEADEQARQQRMAEQRAREEATWTPEYRAWKEACAAIDREHRGQLEQYEEAVTRLEAEFALSLSSSNVVSTIAALLVEDFEFDGPSAIRMLGIPKPDGANTWDVIEKWVGESPSNAQKFLAVFLALRLDEDIAQGPDDPKPIVKDEDLERNAVTTALGRRWNKLVKARKMLRPVREPYPRQPGMNDEAGDEPVSEEERYAIEQAMGGGELEADDLVDGDDESIDKDVRYEGTEHPEFDG